MGNFYYLTLLKQEPHVVANFLKKVLKYMGEPLCTFALYNRFRDLSDTPVDKRCAKLKEICAPMPKINKNVFVFIMKFFNKVTKESEFNKMNLHNMATVITPNLFRPFELTANDLIFASHLVDTFKIMMINYKDIFNVEDDEDDDNLDNNLPVISINPSHKPLIIEEDEDDKDHQQHTSAAGLFNNKK